MPCLYALDCCRKHRDVARRPLNIGLLPETDLLPITTMAAMQKSSLLYSGPCKDRTASEAMALMQADRWPRRAIYSLPAQARPVGSFGPRFAAVSTLICTTGPSPGQPGQPKPNISSKWRRGAAV
jgi:hypothetical protein